MFSSVVEILYSSPLHLLQLLCFTSLACRMRYSWSNAFVFVARTDFSSKKAPVEKWSTLPNSNKNWVYKIAHNVQIHLQILIHIRSHSVPLIKFCLKHSPRGPSAFLTLHSPKDELGKVDRSKKMHDEAQSSKSHLTKNAFDCLCWSLVCLAWHFPSLRMHRPASHTCIVAGDCRLYMYSKHRNPKPPEGK